MSRHDVDQFAEWLKEHRIGEVECLVSDMAGIARGKILPTNKFLSGLRNQTLRLPESIFGQMVTGADAETEALTYQAPDMNLVPDVESLRIVPWYKEPTAQVICDCTDQRGEQIAYTPRSVLRRVVALYQERGWRPIVAPELEFFLAAKNIDPDYPLLPPAGKTGRPQTGRQAYGIDAVNEFDPLFEDVYDYCEAQDIGIDSLIHEEGVAQVEMNFNHGEPLALADQTFLFKRTVRQAALRHDIYATFMAKPYEQEPGSAMHIHQSVVDTQKGKSLFSTKSGKDTRLFLAHIAGLQKHLPAAMPLIAPFVNSYRRLVRFLSAPINTHWGHENRTVGLRVPVSDVQNRRVENRVPGADANPYLAIAASLACGYLGMIENLSPTKAMEGNAYESTRYQLPRHILDSVAKFRASTDLKDVLGETFVVLYSDVKNSEHDAYQQVISPWERQHLLLNV
ncbi:MAG TPA: glutamine synthetase family protein [Rhizomicrobium sp.]|nr:glutamine synthetase family protein [Rhizomicrobium sp.]